MDAQLARLEIYLDANIKRMEEKFARAEARASKAAGKIRTDFDAVNDNIGKKFGKGVFGEFDKSVRNSAAGVPVLGGAMQSAGLSAGIFMLAIGAAAAALAGLRQAMSFADEIGDTATKLQVTTDTLQELRYATHQAGGEFTDADKAIEGFTEKLGLARAGNTRALQWFQQLGFTQEQLSSFKSVDDALVAVSGRIAALSDAAARAAIADKLGLKPMLPLILQGEEGFARLRAEAQRVGYVMDADVIEKLGAANDRFEAMSAIIDVQVKTALAGMLPTLEGIVAMIAKATQFTNEWLGKLAQAKLALATNFSKLPDWAQTGVRAGVAAANKSGIVRVPFSDALDKDYLAKQALEAFYAANAKAGFSGLRADALGGGTSLKGFGGGGAGGGGRGGRATKAKVYDVKDAELYDPELKDIWDRIHALQKIIANAEKVVGKEVDQNVDFRDGPPVFAANQNGKLLTQAQVDGMQDQMSGMFRGAFDALRQGGTKGVLEYLADSFTNRLLDGLSDNLAKVVMDALNQSGSGSGGGSGGGFWTSVVKGVASFFGARANGGDVRAGKPYVVGERGPELIVPGRSGTVIPNGALRGATAGGASRPPAVTLISAPTYQLTGAVMTDELVASINRQNRASMAQMMAMNNKVSRRAMPGLQRQQDMLGTVG